MSPERPRAHQKCIIKSTEVRRLARCFRWCASPPPAASSPLGAIFLYEPPPPPPPFCFGDLEPDETPKLLPLRGADCRELLLSRCVPSPKPLPRRELLVWLFWDVARPDISSSVKSSISIRSLGAPSFLLELGPSTPILFEEEEREDELACPIPKLLPFREGFLFRLLLTSPKPGTVSAEDPFAASLPTALNVPLSPLMACSTSHPSSWGASSISGAPSIRWWFVVGFL